MATKYILQSGGIRNHPAKRKKFHQEVFAGTKKPNVLICFFAQPRENWEEKYPMSCQSIEEDTTANATYRLAMPSTFEDDCKWADIIYMLGGDDNLIQYWLRQFDIPKIWEGKIVSGNSASSHALVKQFWTCDWRKCMDGTGIIPIKFLAHFKGTYGSDDPRGPIDWDAAKKELEGYGNTSLTVHALEEGDYIVIEQ